MKNTREAVKYAIEVLGVTPEEFFSLVESSNGYEGEDYRRWLANEVIKIAEKDGVGFSQLLVKKFSIIQSLAEDSEVSIRPCWLKKLAELIGTENIVSIDFDGLGNPIEGVNWFEGIDYSSLVSNFTLDVLPEDISNAVVNNEDICFITELSNDSPNKSTDLFQACKNEGIQCKNEGSLMLYRMISMIEAFDCGEQFKFAFLSNVSFLYSQENKAIIKHFLKYFNCEGFTVKSTDLYDGTFVSGKYAFVVCTPRVSGNLQQDCIKLSETKLVDGSITKEGEKRYSHSSAKMIDYILNNSISMTDLVYSETHGKINTDKIKGLKNALGYMNIDKSGYTWLTCYPDTDANVYTAITKSNLSRFILYFGVSKSLGHFGLPCEIPLVVNGCEEYSDLLYNCLPIFLYSTDSKFKSHGSIRVMGEIENLVSPFDHFGSLVESLLTKGEVHFSFESKELLSICKGFLDYLESEMNLSSTGMTFGDVRKEANHEELNRSYLSALTNSMDYIKTLYRKME